MRHHRMRQHFLQRQPRHDVEAALGQPLCVRAVRGGPGVGSDAVRVPVVAADGGSIRAGGAGVDVQA